MTDSPETTPAAAACARLPRHRVPAPHRLPHEGRPAEARAADAGALATPEALGAPARTLARPPALRAARRPALRQRPAAHRPRAQQDPEGRGRTAPRRWPATTPTTCRAGTATACRSNGRSRRSTAPRGRDKDAVPVLDFRAECRAYAAHWLDVQREEFQRLGVAGDWERRYATMDFASEAAIVREIGEFLMNGALYRGLRPVMWSPVEKTALAEAEIEYHDHVSPTLWARFPVLRAAAGARTWPARGGDLDHHALDHPRQPRRRLRRGDRLRAGACGGRGGGLAASGSARRLLVALPLLPQFGKDTGLGAHTRQARAEGRGARRRHRRASAARLGRGEGRLRLRRAAAARRFRHHRGRHRLRPHRPRPWRGRLRPRPRPRPAGAGDGQRRRHLHRAGAGLHRPARVQGARRHLRRLRGGGHARRQGEADAQLPAFLALQEAGDLPRHAAMVHRPRRRAPHPRAGARRRSPRRISCPDAGRNRIGSMVGVAARLVRQPPARLGRADRRLRLEAERRAAARPGDHGAHRRGLRRGGRRRLVQARRRRALPRPRPRRPPTTSR